LSHERPKVAEAEAFTVAEGKMCGAAMRGADAPPGSKATSRTKGSCRNLGDLARPAVASAIPGHVGKSRRRSRRGTGEESDGCIVPMKPRTRPSDIGGGDGGGKATGRREGERQRGFPDTAPVTARHRSGKPTDWQRPYLPSRLTFDRSPVRESRSPGSVRGAASNRRPYRDHSMPPLRPRRPAHSGTMHSVLTSGPLPTELRRPFGASTSRSTTPPATSTRRSTLLELHGMDQTPIPSGRNPLWSRCRPN